MYRKGNECFVDTRRQIVSSVNSVLREAGFKRSSLVWNKAHGDVVQVIDLQFHRYSPGTTIRFTANIGLCFPEVPSIVSGKEASRRYREVDCCPRMLIGYLLDGENPKYLDKWWEAATGDDSTIMDFTHSLLNLCVPYFDKNSTLSEMYREASKLKSMMQIGDKLYLAVMSHLLGHADQRDAVFAEVISSRATAWRPVVDRVITQLGLTADRYS